MEGARFTKHLKPKIFVSSIHGTYKNLRLKMFSETFHEVNLVKSSIHGTYKNLRLKMFSETGTRIFVML